MGLLTARPCDFVGLASTCRPPNGARSSSRPENSDPRSPLRPAAREIRTAQKTTKSSVRIGGLLRTLPRKDRITSLARHDSRFNFARTIASSSACPRAAASAGSSRQARPLSSTPTSVNPITTQPSRSPTPSLNFSPAAECVNLSLEEELHHGVRAFPGEHRSPGDHRTQRRRSTVRVTIGGTLTLRLS